jgi:predicted phosphodiesterase
MIAILSDIHGNLHALEAVLADMPLVSQIWSLGDMLTGPPFPCEVLDRLLDLDAPVYAVLGNHEEYLLEIKADRGSRQWGSTQFGALPWVVDRLKPYHWEYISALKPILATENMPGGALLFHGSPESTSGNIYTGEDADKAAAFTGARWLVGGHTHKARLFSTGERKVMIAGSVGMSLDGLGGVSSYVLINEDTGTVSFRYVSYNVEAAVEAMYRAGFAELAPGISRALISQMRTGRNYIHGLITHVYSYAEQCLGYRPTGDVPNALWEEAEKSWDGNEWTEARLR